MVKEDRSKVTDLQWIGNQFDKMSECQKMYIAGVLGALTAENARKAEAQGERAHREAR
nr:MAG TPA: hypothetical protein [Caudoviricetes sp.]